MPTCTTLIGCRGNIMGTWVGGKTGMDVMAIDREGMVCMWQTDFEPDDLDYDFKTTRKVMFSPQRWKDHARVAMESIKIDDEDSEKDIETVEDDENVNNPDEGEIRTPKLYLLYFSR